MSPLTAILQSYHAKVEDESSIYHLLKKSGSQPSLSIDEVVVRVPSVGEPSFTCQSAMLLNELLAKASNHQSIEGIGTTQIRPVSALFGAKDRIADNSTIELVNHHYSQLSTSYPDKSTGFMVYGKCEIDNTLLHDPETLRNPSSSSSMSSANTVLSSLPVSQMYQNPDKAIEQSRLSQIQTNSELYSLVEQDLRFTPALYRMSPFAISHEVDDHVEESFPHSICPWQLQSNNIIYLQPTPVHLKLKRGLLENIQDVFNLTIDDDDDKGVSEYHEGSTIQDCIMCMSVSPSISPRQYALSRLCSPKMNNLAVFKFATTPAPPESFETPVAPETTPVSTADISVHGTPAVDPVNNNHSDDDDGDDDDDITPHPTEATSKASWTNSSDFCNAATSGIDASKLEEYKKAFFSQYSKVSITKIKVAESDKKFLPKNDLKPNYYTLVDNLDIFTCSKLACTKRYKCPVKECPMHFLGIKKRAELKHHVHYEHLKNGFVKLGCREYEDEIMRILFVCNEAGCGKAFYRCDSLNRHLHLVHGNKRKGGGAKRKFVVNDEVELADVELVENYNIDRELNCQDDGDIEVCTTLKRRKKVI